MIELLTKLEPSGTSLPVTNAREDKSLGLIVSARSRNMGGQRQSSSGYHERDFSAPYIAKLLAGVPRHKTDAALVYVNADNQAANRLLEYVVKHITVPASIEWNLSDEKRSIRAAGLASTAVYELSIHPQRLKAERAAALVGVGKSQWGDLWRNRHQEIVHELLDWCSDVSRSMVRRHHGPREYRVKSG